MTVTHARLTGLSRELMGIQAAGRDALDLVRTYAAGLSKLALDDRWMRDRATQLTTVLTRLRRQLDEIQGHLPELAASVQPGGNPSWAGRHGHLRGALRSLQAELELLEAELRPLHTRVTAVLQDPAGAESATVSETLGSLIGLGGVVLELIEKTVTGIEGRR